MARSCFSPTNHYVVVSTHAGLGQSAGTRDVARDAGPPVHPPPALARRHARGRQRKGERLGRDRVRSRLTRGPLDSSSVLIWTPDSARLIFGSLRGGGFANLYVQAADGTGTATRLSDSPNQNNPTGTTAHGAQIVFNELTPTQLGDINLLTMTSTPQVKPLVATGADERGGVVSPDGRWLALRGRQIRGTYEVWVQPFPDRGRRSVAGVHRRRRPAALGAKRARAVLRGA